MRIHALILTYNSIDCLLICLKSLEGKLDNVVILDNKWVGFEDDNPDTISNDGTCTKLMEYGEQPNHVLFTYIQYYEKLHQYEARSYLIEQVGLDDWMLIIDSDEVITKWYDDIKNALTQFDDKHYKVFGKSGRRKIAMPTARLLCRVEGLRWNKDHRFIQIYDEVLDPRHFPIMPIVIEHQDKYDTKTIRKAMTKYEEWLYKWEQDNASNSV